MSCTFFDILDKIHIDKKNVKPTEQFSQRELGQQLSNRMEFKKEIKVNRNSIDQKINNLRIQEQQKENNEEFVKENLKSQKVSEEQEQSNQDKCLICYENQSNILFITCKHGGICEKCIEEDIMLKSNQCYLCRKELIIFQFKISNKYYKYAQKEVNQLLMRLVIQNKQDIQKDEIVNNIKNKMV